MRAAERNIVAVTTSTSPVGKTSPRTFQEDELRDNKEVLIAKGGGAGFEQRNKDLLAAETVVCSSPAAKYAMGFVPPAPANRGNSDKGNGIGFEAKHCVASEAEFVDGKGLSSPAPAKGGNHEEGHGIASAAQHCVATEGELVDYMGFSPPAPAKEGTTTSGTMMRIMIRRVSRTTRSPRPTSRLTCQASLSTDRLQKWP